MEVSKSFWSSAKFNEGSEIPANDVKEIAEDNIAANIENVESEEAECVENVEVEKVFETVEHIESEKGKETESDDDEEAEKVEETELEERLRLLQEALRWVLLEKEKDKTDKTPTCVNWIVRHPPHRHLPQ